MELEQINRVSNDFSSASEKIFLLGGSGRNKLSQHLWLLLWPCAAARRGCPIPRSCANTPDRLNLVLMALSLGMIGGALVHG
jgi:hypothetical protein